MMKLGSKALAVVLAGSFFGSSAPSALAATKTVDFNSFPVTFDHLDWQTVTSHTASSGFSYSLGTGNGQRTNQHGVAWPDSTYYDTVLGSGGYAAVNGWPMKSLVLYATEKNGGWLANGWNYTQDMAEGAAAVDDSARAAIALADDYVLNGTPGSLQRARDLMTFTAYMTTLQGKVYNFAWLDAPVIFSWDPVQQGVDKHFMYRSEFVKRTQYPSALPDSDWMSAFSDPSHILTDASNQYVNAPPFVPHPKYSIYMDDLRDPTGADIAPVYNGPLYTTASGGITGYKTGIKKTWTTSTHEIGLDDARNLWAMVRGLHMMQKVNFVNGTLTADQLFFAKFLENHINRMMNNVLAYNLSGFDTKMASNLLIAFTDYFRLLYGTTDYGTYTPNLPSNSNTAATYDDRPSQSTLYARIDVLLNSITAKQLHTADWRNGIFVDDAAAGNWYAWGELQIYALSNVYAMKRSIGQTPAQLNGLLDIVTYSADHFYGLEAYHYIDGINNFRRTKERITQINGWNAQFHTNSAQFAYQNSSIVVGLKALAEAYYLSGRTDAAAKRAQYLEYARRVATWFVGNNNALAEMYDGASGTGAYKGRGAVFDGITIQAGVPVVNRGAGGESSAEGLWAMIHIKKAISQYGLSSTFSFDY